MPVENLLTTKAFAKFWRTVLIDLLKGKVLNKLKKITAPSLEDLFLKAVRNANVDLEPEKAKEILHLIKTSKPLKKRLEAFEYNHDLLDIDFLIPLFQNVVGNDYLAFKLSSDIFVELQKLIADQPEMADEILLVYGDKLLTKLEQHDADMHLEHQNLSKEIQELTKYIEENSSEHKLETHFDRYMHHLNVECSRLPLGILDPQFQDPEQKDNIRLENIYTQLDSMDVKNIKDEIELNRFYRDMEKQERVSLLELVNEEDRLLILGNPGSGKSTFMNYLGYVLSQVHLDKNGKNLFESLQPWSLDQIVPVRIVIRELSEATKSQKPSYTLVTNFVRKYLENNNLEKFWPTLEEWMCASKPQQKLLFFFDGLDEVSEEWRNILIKSINDFVDRYRSHRYVVTCRPYAYVGQDIKLQGFHQITIASLTFEQVDYFIDAWYHELARLNKIKQDVITERVNNFQKEIRKRDLTPLIDRPLILTLTALLHASGRGELPSIPVDLYEDVVDLLLDRWQRKDDEQPGLLEFVNVQGLEMPFVKSTLYEIAFEAHQQQTDPDIIADINEGDLLVQVEQSMKIPIDAAKRFVDYIRDRAGLLIRHKQHAFTFPHRTFQEFLAACYIVRQDDFAIEIVERIKSSPDQWREVYLLAVARAARGDKLSSSIDAVNRLCPHEYQEITKCTATNYEHASLAGMGLLEIGEYLINRDELAQKIKKRLAGIQGWLVNALTDDKTLQPIKRAEAGRVLAKLGDPRSGVGVNKETNVPDILWCRIPGGTFQMGEGDEQHPVTLDSFYMSRYPVTNAQFNKFVKQEGYSNPQYWTEAKQAGRWKEGRVKMYFDKEWRQAPYDFGEPFHLRNHPVVGISWYEALAFCKWLNEHIEKMHSIAVWEKVGVKNKKLLHEVSIIMPSEAEWECAARGGQEAKFPWGTDNIDANHANFGETKINTTSAVGCFPAGENDFGLLDISGNVWEWTRSHYKEYPYAAKDRERLNASDDVRRVVRGGSYFDNAEDCRCASRDWSFPVSWCGYLGFRVVLSPVSSSVL